MKNEIKKYELKKKKNQANPSKSPKHKLILQTFNQEIQFPINFIFKDRIEKNYEMKKISKFFKNKNKKI